MREVQADEIVALWTRYLTGAHPDEGRAYMERADQLGRLEETKGDLEQASERGITEGCARLRR